MPLLLTKHDCLLDLWAKLKHDYTERLAILRAKNDGDHDPVKTAFLRGQINECQKFLDLEPK